MRAAAGTSADRPACVADPAGLPAYIDIFRDEDLTYALASARPA